MDAVNTNTERQRRLRQRRKEAGLVDYRRAVTPEQAKALDAFLSSLDGECQERKEIIGDKKESNFARE